jgi:hypothetical protein
MIQEKYSFLNQFIFFNKNQLIKINKVLLNEKKNNKKKFLKNMAESSVRFDL